MTHDHSRPQRTPQCFWGSRYSIGLVLLGAVAAYFLLSEHRAHLLGTLPLLLLVLACPLIHRFMHRGQARHESRQEDAHDARHPPRSSANENPPQRKGQP